MKSVFALFFIFVSCSAPNDRPLSWENDEAEGLAERNDDRYTKRRTSGKKGRRSRGSRGGGGSSSSSFTSLCDRSSSNFQQAVLSLLPDDNCNSVSASDLNSIMDLQVRAFLSSLTLEDLDDFHSLERFHLNNTGLTTLPENVFEPLRNNLRLLNLSGNNFDSLPTNLFLGLSKVLDLDLSDNNLTVLSSSLFSGLSSLEVLYLSGNSLERLSANFFNGMPRLEELDLSDNNLTAGGLPAGLFTNLQTLSELDLRGNDRDILNIKRRICSEVSSAETEVIFPDSSNCP